MTQNPPNIRPDLAPKMQIVDSARAGQPKSVWFRLAARKPSLTVNVF